MKTFKDLNFKSHWAPSSKAARIHFGNGYGVSVLLGNLFYSNGIDTYEVAILKNGNLCYDTPITDDVLGGLTENEVTEVMKQVQML